MGNEASQLRSLLAHWLPAQGAFLAVRRCRNSVAHPAPRRPIARNVGQTPPLLATYHVGLPHLLVKKSRKSAAALRRPAVPEFIIQALARIDVGHDDSQALAMAAGALDLLQLDLLHDVR